MAKKAVMHQMFATTLICVTVKRQRLVEDTGLYFSPKPSYSQFSVQKQPLCYRGYNGLSGVSISHIIILHNFDNPLFGAIFLALSLIQAEL